MPAVLSNRLLTSLSSETRHVLDQRLEGVPMPVGTPLFETGSVPKYAYFLTSGIASVVADMQTGSAVEVGLDGCEALPGAIHLLGGQPGSTRCFMQVDGTAMRMSFQQLQQLFVNLPELRGRVLQAVHMKLCLWRSCLRATVCMKSKRGLHDGS